MAEFNQSMFGFSLDDLSHYSSTVSGYGAIGSVNSAITNNLFGLNHRQTPSVIPHNRDNYGYVFLTRPQLNLQPWNIRNDTRFFPLLTTNKKSYQLAIANTLDPRLAIGWGGFDAVSSDFVDPELAFIPMLTNQCVAASGFRDKTAPTYSSPDGLYKESMSFVDGTTKDYTVFDINLTFRNVIGNPLGMLFNAWIDYASCVFEGILNPYPDMILKNAIDYNTRIYRITLDPSKKYVQNILATGAAFPISYPNGSVGDFNIDKPYNDANAEISVPFRAMGCIYNEEMLIWAFNNTVGIFNSSIREASVDTATGSVNSPNLTKIPRELLGFFNHRGYPYINTKTYELEWYLQNEILNARLAVYENIQTELITNTFSPMRTKKYEAI